MRHQGFTLAELLIALAILGVIATFTIPKVLNAQQDGQYNAIAKEMAAAVSEAYQSYKLENSPTASTAIQDLTPYLNYVAVDSVTLVDNNPFAGSISCSNAGTECLKLHNGGIFHYPRFITFDGTTALNNLIFCVDPSGVDDDITAQCFVLYYNGRLTSQDLALSNSCNSFSCPFGPTPVFKADWFSWD